ncbi:MAG: trimethylamine methyltransferase family protein [Candidatus Bathyarchaeota archaeon]|nr:MAG: trimethylamine methyltransferase family protein [Candidatus Bathyarchaeota archaeon]
MEHSREGSGFIRGEDLRRIHSSTLKVLEETGVRVDEEDARKLLDDAGAYVDSKRKIVRIPQNLVEELITKARRCARLCGRNSKNDLTLKEGRFHVMTSSTGVRVLDLATGKVRPSTKKDVEDSARLADALENFHIYSIMVDALDCPSEIMGLEEIDAMFNNTEKHIDTGALGTDNARDMIQMAAVVAGGFEELRKRPIIDFMQTPVSPLIHERENTEGILECAKHEIPLIILNMAQAGGTSPMTIAGTLSITNAEVLSGMLIAYLQNPNVPLIYGTSSIVLNMKSLPKRSIFGLVENGLIAMGAAQLAGYYGFPSLVNGFSGGWSGLDDDSLGFLWSMMAILPTLANADILYDGGLIENSKTLSYEDMVISNEITGMVLRCMRGIKVDGETLADDLIHKVGPAGNFLAEKHTLEHLRKEIVAAEILDKSKVKDIQETARERARNLLSAHQPEPLEKSIQEELRGIVKKAWKRERDRK